MENAYMYTMYLQRSHVFKEKAVFKKTFIFNLWFKSIPF